MLWEELTAKNFEKAAAECGGVCLLPLGVLEKHGDHLPIGTDMYTGTLLCKQAAEREAAIVFPYYFFGQIAEAMHYPGTVSLPHRMLMENLLAICDEIGRNGLKKILIVSSHGGNNAFLPFFAQEMPRLNRDYTVYVTTAGSLNSKQRAKFAEAAGSEDFGAHAGLTETSMMMHLRPDLIHMEDCDERDCVSLDRLSHLKGLNTGFNWYANYPNHFAGSPKLAKPELGKMLAEMAVENLAEQIRAVKADTVSAKLSTEYAERLKKPDASVRSR